MADEIKNKANARKAGNRNKASNENSTKESVTTKSGEGVQEESFITVPNLKRDFQELAEKEADISSYVSNLDKNVYAISGLPEEFVATLFAWVSRSDKSFRDHLRQAVTEFQLPVNVIDPFAGLNKKAKDFHEKWTVGYGHSSVAEHATAHVGIENISRLASAELELANPFMSITEYSQRYQKPERGKWHIPFSSKEIGSVECDMNVEVHNFYHNAFDVFEKLISGVYKHLASQHVNEDGSIDKVTSNQLMKLAFEDARYALPLGQHSQLGMTANGRAWRDALAQLGNSDHPESIAFADEIREEVTKVLPVLLKYATPSQYQNGSKMRMKARFDKHNKVSNQLNTASLNTVKEERLAILDVVALLIMKHENMSFTQAHAKAISLGTAAQDSIIKELIFDMKHFDMAPEEFKHVNYSADILVSEANWHQLLRHNRMTDFIFSKPSANFGITMPPRIVEAGLQDLLKGIADEAEELYNRLVEEGFDKEAEYVVLNAHRRHIHMSFTLWEAYHLINLRTSDEAQWDIRDTFENLFTQLTAVHPLLISEAKRRD